MSIVMGVIAGLASLIMGFWTKANVYEKHSAFKRIGSFVLFAPLGVLGGLAMTECFGIYWAFGIIPVAIGSIFSNKLEEYLRRELRAGDGPTAAWFMEAAKADGEMVSRQFQINAIKLSLNPTLRNEKQTVDDLIEAYNSARNQFGLESIEGLDKKAPYI